LEFLQTVPPKGTDADAADAKIKALDKPVIGKEDIKRLEVAKAEEDKNRRLEFFKFSTNEEMLQIMGLVETV